MECVNYVIAHKDYPIMEDGLYRTLCVGKYRRDGALCETDGENISEYNDRLNETTGVFWIWKNATAECVGLSHYRRFFCNGRYPGDASRLDADRIHEILSSGYDMILTENIRLWKSRGEIIADDIGAERYRDAVRILTRLMERVSPEYKQPMLDTLTGDRMYYLNMFVTRKEILDRYCEWLFSFICDAADLLDVRGCVGRQRRAMGFFSETMMTVWLQKQDLKVYSLQHVNTDGEEL